MNVPYYQVNAFSKGSFSGNPTGVCILKDWLSTDELQSIATQSHLPQTVFLFLNSPNQWSIRWFSPLIEIDLSGHGTLAASHILFEEGFTDVREPLHFSSSVGELKVEKAKNGLLCVEMPSFKSRICVASPLLVEGLGAYPDETYIGMDCMCVFSNESTVEDLKPEPRLLKRIGSARGIIATSLSADPKIDYVTRFFAPRCGVDEDEVTGSIHSVLAPYWSKKLGKDKMRVKQLSPRGTQFRCGIQNDRVWVEGKADIFIHGQILI